MSQTVGIVYLFTIDDINYNKVDGPDTVIHQTRRTNCSLRI